MTIRGDFELSILFDESKCNDDKTYIKYLEKEIEKRDWINIKDRLPENKTKVIIAILHNYVNMLPEYSITIALYNMGDWIGEGNHGYINPTYWMPFPNLPDANKCPTCSGKGSHYDDETGIETCPDCGGKGI